MLTFERVVQVKSLRGKPIFFSRDTTRTNLQCCSFFLCTRAPPGLFLSFLGCHMIELVLPSHCREQFESEFGFDQTRKKTHLVYCLWFVFWAQAVAAPLYPQGLFFSVFVCGYCRLFPYATTTKGKHSQALISLCFFSVISRSRLVRENAVHLHVVPVAVRPLP